MEVLEFYYRVYPDRCTIQLKPCSDKTNHFSIVWPAKRGTIAKEDFEAMDAQIRHYIEQRGGQLEFQIIKACENCTYGRFEAGFEQLVLSTFRTQYAGINCVKDLPLDDAKHQHLKTTIVWDEDHPIAFHIHSRSPDKRFTDIMKSPMGTVVVLNIGFK